jgi:acyl dehydratase
MSISDLQARVGQTIGTSEWVELTQDKINQFAEATGDFQFIHVDPQRAKETPFGQTIAHGFMSISLLAPMIEEVRGDMDVAMVVNYGLNKARFLSPVKSGKRVRGHFKLLELVEKRPGQWQQVLEATVEIEGEDKPALIAEWILQLFE